MATEVGGLFGGVSVMSSYTSKLSPLQSKITRYESEVEVELKVVVEANILTNPMEKAPTVTVNYNYPPKLAQDIADVEELPPTFMNPLSNLRLDEAVSNLDNLVTDKKSDKSKAATRTSLYSVYNTRGPPAKMTKRKYLHSTPNKYVPIPPLERSAYFYSYGRCPDCAGNGTYDTKHSENVKPHIMWHRNFKGNSTNDTEKKIIRSSNTMDKSSQLEHLEGKTKRKISDGRRKSCFNFLDSHLINIKGVSQDDWEVERRNDATRDYHSPMLRAAPGTSIEMPVNRPATNFYTDNSDQASIATFGSAALECRHGKVESKYSTEFNSACKKMSTERFTPRNQLKPYVADLRGMYPGGVILSAKIKDYDFHIPLISLKTDEMRDLYKVTILKDFSLRRLFDKKNFKNLPSELQYLRTIKNEYNPEDGIVKIADTEGDRDLGFRTIMGNTCLSIINEIANQFYEADFCVLGLFVNWFERAKPDSSLRQLSTAKEFARLFQILGDEVFYNSYNPAGCIRIEMLIVMSTASRESRLRHFMWAHVKHWLEPLLCGLFSFQVGTREETCYTLAYMFSSNMLSEDIRHNQTFDIAFDTVAAVIKAIELKPDTFMHYYCLLGYILEGCPNYSILDCIVAKAPLCKHILFRQRWPLFVYYAFRHWDIVYLTVDSVFPKKMVEAMEIATFNPISKKAARLAMKAITMKMRKPVACVTVWTLDWLPKE